MYKSCKKKTYYFRGHLVQIYFNKINSVAKEFIIMTHKLVLSSLHILLTLHLYTEI